jgi:hypothetical protein
MNEDDKRHKKLAYHHSILIPGLFEYCREADIDTFDMIQMLIQWPTQIAINTLKKPDVEHLRGAMTACAGMHRLMADELMKELGKENGVGIYSAVLSAMNEGKEEPAKRGSKIERSVRDEIKAIDDIDLGSPEANEAFAKFSTQMESIFGKLLDDEPKKTGTA